MRDIDLLRHLRGSFTFLQPGLPDLRLLGLETLSGLPLPQRVFLESEAATPAAGFPVLQSPGMLALREAAERYVRAEEKLEVALAEGQAPDRRRANSAWEAYRKLLARATENAVSSSFGRGYPGIFWLFHSIAVSRLFKETPRRLRRLSLPIGKARGDQIKYRVFHRYLDRVLQVTYEVVSRVALQTEEEEKEIFPAVLNRMRDNVLILTEDHVSPDLGELDSYFVGYLRIDGREFRRRLAALTDWHREEIEGNASPRRSVRHLLSETAAHEPARLLTRPGYLSFLAEGPEYDDDRFLPKEWLPIWESLLLKLKEFELLAALRRMVVPTFREEGGRLKCSASSIGRSRPGLSEIALSSSTRPQDFMTPWVVDPLVRRFGLVYDITDFSAVISTLRRAGSETQDDSYRRIFTFQRRINRMARDHRLRLEKYLGDGAFYSGRYPERLLAAAIQLQRYYRRALTEDFPFNHGLRIALNYGRYRLLPIEGAEGGAGHRYEFFGHGIVELSRLVTGKSMREIEDVKTLLVSRGYAPLDVERFFAPVARRSVYLVDKAEEARPFHAYINSNGVLINEGIVATEPYLAELDRTTSPGSLSRIESGGRSYVLVTIENESDVLRAGVRKLGTASLKGLGEVAIYEVVDAQEWPAASAAGPAPGRSLMEALERQFEALTANRAQPLA